MLDLVLALMTLAAEYCLALPTYLRLGIRYSDHWCTR